MCDDLVWRVVLMADNRPGRVCIRGAGRGALALDTCGVVAAAGRGLGREASDIVAADRGASFRQCAGDGSAGVFAVCRTARAFQCHPASAVVSRGRATKGERGEPKAAAFQSAEGPRRKICLPLRDAGLCVCCSAATPVRLGIASPPRYWYGWFHGPHDDDRGRTAMTAHNILDNDALSSHATHPRRPARLGVSARCSTTRAVLAALAAGVTSTQCTGRISYCSPGPAPRTALCLPSTTTAA